MKVLFLPEVVDQFLELAQILYDKGYLNSKDAAIEYSEKPFREIQTKLPLKVKKEAPAYYKRYGSDILYSAFRHSRHTTWYVLYSAYNVDGDTVFLVRHLTNNHVIAGHPQKSVDLREMFGYHLDAILIICIFAKIFEI